MKKFEILRYLKRFSLLIFLVALAGAAAIYLYADGRQMYTASVIIRYTNDGISDGYTPDGSDLDVNEIYSSTVISQAMDALGCPPPDTIVDVLSGGERRRVALCKLLLQQPDLLLLDEPTNHLDAESVAWLEGHLKSYPGAVLCITHDRYFLDNVVGWICEIDRGRLYPYEGNYSTYLETKRKRLTIEGQKDAKRAKILERELEWVRSSPKARQAKNKARLARYE